MHVCRPVGVEGIDVLDGRDVFVENDNEKFADKVVYLLQNPNKRAEFGKNSCRIIEKYYSWDVIGEKMIRTYTKLIVK